MKKRKLLLISLIATCSIAVAGALVANASQDSISVTGDKNPYKIVLNADNHVTNVSEYDEKHDCGFAKTKLGNEIEFEYSKGANITHTSCFIEFESSGGEVRNLNPINGLFKLEYKCNRDLKLWYGFSSDNLHNYQVLSSSGSHSYDPSVSVVLQCDFGYSSYFKIAAENDAQIFELAFSYTCDASEDPYRSIGTWDYSIHDAYATIHGFTINSEDIPEDGVLVVPAGFESKFVNFIDAEVFANVPWVRHIVLPFVGRSRYIEESVSHEFGSIFRSSNPPGDMNYVAIQQHDNTWYIPANLRTVTILNGNRDYDWSKIKIPNYAFYGADRLTQINIIGPTTSGQVTDYHVQIIGSYTFANCTGLTELYLPTSITTIDDNAFAGDSNLIIRNYGTATISDGANPDNAKVTENYIETVTSNGIIYDLYKSGDNTYANAMGKASSLSSVLRLYRDVTVRGQTYRCLSVANQAFTDEDGVERIILNGGMQKVGHLAFKGCSYATILIRDTGEDDSVYLSDWDKDTGLVVPNYGGGSSSYEFLDVSYTKFRNDETNTGYIADSITNVSATAIRLDKFEPHDHVYTRAYFADGNETIEEVYLPKDITMGDYSFYNCSELAIVQYAGTKSEWEDLVSSGRIGVNVFANSKVTEVICDGGTEPVLYTPLAA